MATDTVYENQHTISPRLNKQYATVVNLGTVTVWYDRWKERLSEHADHIKTLGKCNKKQKKHTHTQNPFKLNLSVNHCQWKTAATESEWSTLHSVSGKLFFCLQSVCNIFTVWHQESKDVPAHKCKGKQHHTVRPVRGQQHQHLWTFTQHSWLRRWLYSQETLCKERKVCSRRHTAVARCKKLCAVDLWIRL